MRRADEQYRVRYLGSSGDTGKHANYEGSRLKCVKNNRIFSDDLRYLGSSGDTGKHANYEGSRLKCEKNNRIFSD